MLTAGERIDWIADNCRVPNTGKPIELQTFQTDFVESLYGDGVLAAGLSIPRGNGKTGLLACIALAELFLNPYAPDIACAGVTLEQSARPSGVYGVAKAMVLANPDLLNACKIHRNHSNPHIEVAGGQLACVAIKDPDGLLGGSWSLAIADEFGSDVWTDERYGNIVQSTGKRGADSRVVGISTPNSQRSAMFTMRESYKAGRSSSALRWTEFSSEGDPGDRATWFEANPALGKFLDIAALEMDFLDRPLWQFKMMRLGLWVDADSAQGWLGLEGAQHWDNTATDIEFDLTEPVFIGCDKSVLDDLTAVVALQRNADRWLSKCFIFKPSPRIDHAAVRDKIRELARTYKVAAIGYDPRFFVESAQDLTDEGLPMVSVNQGPGLIAPYQTLHKAITEERFFHDEDEDYRLAMLSAVPKMQANGGFTLSKNASRVKIDAAVATAIALSVSDIEPPQTEFKFLF
ncbi:MAG: terminase TerL endonuclease subunit [Ilumatobacteraceae bacterium]